MDCTARPIIPRRSRSNVHTRFAPPPPPHSTTTPPPPIKKQNKKQKTEIAYMFSNFDNTYGSPLLLAEEPLPTRWVGCGVPCQGPSSRLWSTLPRAIKHRWKQGSRSSEWFFRQMASVTWLEQEEISLWQTRYAVTATSQLDRVMGAFLLSFTEIKQSPDNPLQNSLLLPTSCIKC